MLFTRWKLVTGAFGLSVGGFATFGGTTPPPAESPLMVRADQKVNVPPPPSVAPTTVAAAPAPVLPPLPAFPPAAVSDKPNKGTIPGLTTAGTYTPDLDVPIRTSTSPVIELPGLPIPDSKPTETKAPTPPKPAKPMDLPVVPASGFELPTLPSAPPVTTPSSLPSAPPVTPFAPPMAKPAPTTTPEPLFPVVEYTKPAPAPAAPTVAAAPSKFRIVLRVGAGDPTFEVRHDDDLVMKVVCEKVDIKSPEKGQGPSNVIATGKVRFVGFGAEGTCDSFSFLAGTGEVALAGNVNVKVRDKIGRVESELHADKMQYKLDQTALTGVLKP